MDFLDDFIVTSSTLMIIKSERHILCFVGDIHGDFMSIVCAVKRIKLEGVVYIVCGDCGFGPNSHEYYRNILRKINKILQEYKSECYFVRGNHDDKSYFCHWPFKFSNIKAIPDYTVISTPEHNVLCIGGGISIDRKERERQYKENIKKYIKYHKCNETEASLKVYKTYWTDEIPLYEEEELENLTEKIDIVATHAAPSFASPLTKENIKTWIEQDPELYDDLSYERSVMDKIYDKLSKKGHTINLWAYGHYHFHKTEFINNTKFMALDKCHEGNPDIVVI